MNKKIIIVVLPIFLTLSVGYALFNENLKIGGTAKASAKFSLIFKSVGELTGKGWKEDFAAIISENQKILEINITNLKYPGTYVNISTVTETALKR